MDPHYPTFQSYPPSRPQYQRGASSMSTSTSASTSNSSGGGIANPNPPFASMPMPSPMQSDAHSTSSTSLPAYFATQPGASNTYAPVSHPPPQAPQQRSTSSANPSQQAQSFAHMGQRGGQHGGVPETAPYLQGSSLVAEAAKRAQVACLTRDLGDFDM